MGLKGIGGRRGEYYKNRGRHTPKRKDLVEIRIQCERQLRADLDKVLLKQGIMHRNQWLIDFLTEYIKQQTNTED